MTELEKYQKNILREIKREFSKDEVVVLLFNQIKEKDIELGKLKSYIEELEETINIRDQGVHIKKWKDKYKIEYHKNQELENQIKSLKINHEKKLNDYKARLSVLRNWNIEQGKPSTE